MSEEKKPERVKTIADVSESIRGLLRTEPVPGDTRKTRKRFRRGHTFNWSGYDRPFTLTENVTMDVTEEYTSDERWVDKTFHIDTTKAVSKSPEEEEVRLGWWARLRIRLFGPRLPRARVME